MTSHHITVLFKQGGCDGCIDVNDPSNLGPMLETLERLDDLYEANGYAQHLSKADLYALAGIFAVEEGIRNANEACRDDSNCIIPMVTNKGAEQTFYIDIRIANDD